MSKRVASAERAVRQSAGGEVGNPVLLARELIATLGRPVRVSLQHLRQGLRSKLYAAHARGFEQRTQVQRQPLDLLFHDAGQTLRDVPGRDRVEGQGSIIRAALRDEIIDDVDQKEGQTVGMLV